MEVKKLKPYQIELIAMTRELEDTCKKFGWHLGELGDIHFAQGVMRINTSLIRIFE